MNIARALSGKWKKDVTRIGVMLGVVSVLRIASYLGGLRVSGFVRSTRGRKDKVAEEGFVRGIKEGNENIGAFAGSNQRRAGGIGNAAFMNDGRILFERIPMVNISGCLGHFV